MNTYTKLNTCKGKVENTCAMWDAYKEKCPFYEETKWEDKITGDTWSTYDCDSRRTKYCVLEMRERLIALQQANEQQRNTTTTALGLMLETADQISKIPIIAHANVEMLESGEH